MPVFPRFLQRGFSAVLIPIDNYVNAGWWQSAHRLI